MITEALFCLALNVYHEARSQPLIEQLAVAQVVLNRVESSTYPDNVCGVVYHNKYPGRLHKCQFSWACDGANDTPKNATAWLRANQIASLALSPELPDLVGGATHYHATYVHPGWANSLEPVATIGRHRFYR
jgi:spore germination cell wall hydrolase CwlJ-like protein